MAAELASYIQSIDADPARLAVVQERRAALNQLVRVTAPAASPRTSTSRPRAADLAGEPDG